MEGGRALRAKPAVDYTTNQGGRTPAWMRKSGAAPTPEALPMRSLEDEPEAAAEAAQPEQENARVFSYGTPSDENPNM